jgi:4-diphosphocytidyl-2-C-methyl-D-erythritol kinase
MWKITLFSPAKINLFLRILRKRDDGYHELASLFQTIALGDILDIALSSQDSLICSDPSLPANSSNLVWKAAELFRCKTTLDFGFKIHLQKNIPSQAGLGGGSSNAATTLFGLNQLLGQPASKKDLISWAAEIGSDVPFFFTQGTAYVTGRGDIIKDLPPLPFPKEKFWIVKPTQGLSTPEVYKALNLQNLSNRDPLKALQNFLNGQPDFYNDLEEAAFSLFPELAFIKTTLLRSGYDPVLLSGSGSAFFCRGSQNPILLFPTYFVYPIQFIQMKGFLINNQNS